MVREVVMVDEAIMWAYRAARLERLHARLEELRGRLAEDFDEPAARLAS